MVGHVLVCDTLRKTFGYHYYKMTQDVVSLQRILCHSSRRETLIYIGVIQEEMFDSTKSMTLNDAAYHIRLSKQSARKYVGELMDAGLAIQSGKRPLKIRASESLKGILEAGMGEDAGEHGGKTQQEETETARITGHPVMLRTLWI